MTKSHVSKEKLSPRGVSLVMEHNLPDTKYTRPLVKGVSSGVVKWCDSLWKKTLLNFNMMLEVILLSPRKQ